MKSFVTRIALLCVCAVTAPLARTVVAKEPDQGTTAENGGDGIIEAYFAAVKPKKPAADSPVVNEAAQAAKDAKQKWYEAAKSGSPGMAAALDDYTKKQGAATYLKWQLENPGVAGAAPASGGSTSSPGTSSPGSASSGTASPGTGASLGTPPSSGTQVGDGVLGPGRPAGDKPSPFQAPNMRHPFGHSPTLDKLKGMDRDIKADDNRTGDKSNQILKGAFDGANEFAQNLPGDGKPANPLDPPLGKRRDAQPKPGDGGHPVGQAPETAPIAIAVIPENEGLHVPNWPKERQIDYWWGQHRAVFRDAQQFLSTRVFTSPAEARAAIAPFKTRADKVVQELRKLGEKVEDVRLQFTPKYNM